MLAALEELKRAGIPFWYEGVSALDQYYKVSNRPFYYVLVEGSLVDLAKILPGLRYPGREHIDAEFTPSNEEVVYFRCMEAQDRGWTPSPLFSLLYEPVQGKFLDPFGIYGTLRKKRVTQNEWETLLGYEAALLIAGMDSRWSRQIPFLPYRHRQALRLCLWMCTPRETSSPDPYRQTHRRWSTVPLPCGVLSPVLAGTGSVEGCFPFEGIPSRGGCVGSYGRNLHLSEEPGSGNFPCSSTARCGQAPCPDPGRT